ncbi:adenine deaminase [Amylibacter marinus]|uniref:Adenine deaminase n=1 Tax=Amylibacter marinus TaxID=1475483 RepID=A0ABQ5VVP3_9RHOB|nr:adenosine deaminase [Amylibacter marinus]GLQ35252.1 adenine deaminase [Amylibacter marinus]
MDIEKLIDQLPKTELHLHIEGTLEPKMMLDLAKRNKVTLPYETVDQVAAAYQFNNLQDFLDVYYQGMSVLIEERDFYDLTWAYLEKVHGDAVRHVEIFFDPQAHMERGVSFETVLGGITSALAEAHRQLEISSKLIMCFLRHLPEEAGYEALECACKHKEHIYAVGLDSSEAGRPPELFSRLFASARDHGFKTVAHAGEEGPAAYIKTALDDLRVSRVDHGNRAFEDPALIARLAQQQTPMTMCPLSNLRLKGISDLTKHPIKRALDAGLLATVNSDDPSYFGGYINDNYRAVAKAVGLTAADIIKLSKNSVIASFLPDGQKQNLLDAIDTQVSTLAK